MKKSFARCALFLSLGLLFHEKAHAQSNQSALRFYGTGTNQQDRVRVAIDDNTPGPDGSAPCDVGAGSFTVEFWLKGNLADNGTSNAGGDVEMWDFSWINGNIIVDRDIWGDSSADWGVSIAGGYIRFGTGRGDAGNDSENTIEGNVNVVDGAWRHVACVRDASTGIKRIYVDAVEDFLSSAAASDDDISYPNDGVSNPVTQWNPYIVLAAEKHDAGPSYPSFNGLMDEVRIWTTARTQNEIQSTYNRIIPQDTPGLVAYYRFEEGAGTSVADSSAAGSPSGELLAGVPGNGEWTTDTAPVTGSYDTDLNDDTFVNAPDLGILMSDWSRADYPSSDIDVSGLVDVADLALLLGDWGYVHP